MDLDVTTQTANAVAVPPSPPCQQCGSKSFEAQVKALIAAAEEKIALIDSQIRDLQCMRDREYGQIASLKLVIAPIRKLPNELLMEIFCRAVWCVQSALWLSQVCKHWRQLAHATPALWTQQPPLHLPKGRTHTPESIATVKTYLERSRPFPISLRLHCYSWDTEIPPALADVLLLGAPRWEHLDVWDCRPVLQALAKLPGGTLNTLRTVALREHGRIEAPVASVFLCAPLLREVTLWNADVRLFPMPWAQLTHLEMQENDFALCLNILLQSTSLVHATIRARGGDNEAANNAPPTSTSALITLPFLETLDLSLPSGDEINSCFARLALPKLRKLRIYFTDPDLDFKEWAPISTLFTQFQLRSPSIEDFSLSVCRIYPPELYPILLHAPRLTHLHLEMCYEAIDDFVLAQLERDDGNTSHLVPDLQELLLWEIGESFSEEQLLSTIRSRWWATDELQAMAGPPPVARWERVDISRREGAPDLSDRFERRVGRLKAQGLNVEVS
ncbi:hypothetical protein R3P38DRAFT_3250522 [Favolaschia claudopus]|uniref:F-box domain-containing protein n=1 Tax=Favolaschia claudopus TaxID=2862362 RepID=A0AAW0EII7_9AGAR